MSDFFYIRHKSLCCVDLLQSLYSGNVHRHHSCRTFKARLFRMGISMDDGHRKSFQALLVDIYFVIFYSLSAGSRLWT